MARGPAKLTLEIGGKLTASFRKSLKSAQKNVSTFRQNVTRNLNDAAAGAAKGFKDVLRNDAFQAAAVGAAAIGTGLVSAVRTAQEFESSMLKVKAISGATEAEFRKLESQAKLLGRTTQFSASQAAEAMTFLSMAGYDTTQVLDSTGHMLSLAAAGSLELGEAADIASNILGGMGMKVSETNTVIDVLAKTAASGNTDIQMLGESFKSIAAIAPQAGVSIQDAGAAFAILGNSGLQASEAGTALRNILLRLSAPPSEAAKAFDKLSISTKDAAGNLRPYEDILRDMNRRMTELNLGTAEQNELTSAIFGVRATAAGSTLMQAAASGELAKMVDKVTDSEGAAAEMAKTMQSGLGGALTRLQSAAEGLAISFGGPLLEPIASVAEALANMLSPVAGLLESMPILATVAGAVAAGFVGFVTIVPILAAVKGAMVALGISATGMWAAITGPIGLTVLGIVGLVAAFQFAYNKVDWFRAGVDAAMQAVAAVFSWLKEYISNVFQVLGGVFDVFIGLLTGDSERAVAGVGNIFGGLGDLWNMTIGKMIDGLGNFLNAIPEILGQVKALFWNLPGMLMGVGEAIVKTIQEGFMKRFEAFRDAVGEAFQQVRNLLPFSDAKEGPFSDLTKSGRAIVETIAHGVRDRQQKLAEVMSETAALGTDAFGQGMAKPFKPLVEPRTITAPSYVPPAAPVTRLSQLPTPSPTVSRSRQSPGLFDFLGALLPVAGQLVPEAQPFLPAAGQLMELGRQSTTQGSAASASVSPQVTINVAGSNASPEEIAAAVSQGIDDALNEAEAGVRALLND